MEDFGLDEFGTPRCRAVTPNLGEHTFSYVTHDTLIVLRNGGCGACTSCRHIYSYKGYKKRLKLMQEEKDGIRGYKGRTWAPNEALAAFHKKIHAQTGGSLANTARLLRIKYNSAYKWNRMEQRAPDWLPDRIEAVLGEMIGGLLGG